MYKYLHDCFNFNILLIFNFHVDGYYTLIVDRSAGKHTDATH